VLHIIVTWKIAKCLYIWEMAGLEAKPLRRLEGLLSFVRLRALLRSRERERIETL
jgi:hypothetical protein